MNTSVAKETALDESAVIRKVIAGNASDFAILVERHQNMIFSMIMRQTGDEATSRDLAQETFIKAFKSLRTFNFKSAFPTWLVRIALNTTSSYFSSSKFTQSKLNVSFSAEMHEKFLQQPESEPFSAEQLTQLQVFLAALAAPYREVLVLCAIEGKSYREAGEILQIPAGTVSSRMTKGMRMLRDKFKRVAV